MTLEPMLRLIAGAFVIASVLLGMYVHPYFLWFTVFVGANLLQSAFTKWCPMMTILRRAGVRERWAVVVLAAAIPLAAPAIADAQHAGPGGGGCMMGAGGGMADMPLIHELFANRDKVRRTVTVRPDGVETTTESDDPAIAKTIQSHVAAMYERVRDGRGIHLRDPLFRELFAHASKIAMSHELTPKGVKVVETSTDPYVAKLIQAHAEVVTRFMEKGHVEAMTNHAVPDKNR